MSLLYEQIPDELDLYHNAASYCVELLEVAVALREEKNRKLLDTLAIELHNLLLDIKQVIKEEKKQVTSSEEE